MAFSSLAGWVSCTQQAWQGQGAQGHGVTSCLTPCAPAAWGARRCSGCRRSCGKWHACCFAGFRGNQLVPEIALAVWEIVAKAHQTQETHLMVVMEGVLGYKSMLEFAEQLDRAQNCDVLN